MVRVLRLLQLCFLVVMVVLHLLMKMPDTQEEELDLHMDAQEDVQKLVHVCFSSDDKDMQSLIVAINSTVMNAQLPGRLFFHVITASALVTYFTSVLRQYLPDLRLEVHNDTHIENHILSIIPKKHKVKRSELLTPFNFAQFYMDRFIQFDVADANRSRSSSSSSSSSSKRPSKLIYLDTDVVVLGDIAELHDMDLVGQPVGAIEDCTQRFATYFNFQQIWHNNISQFHPNRCVFNRGIFIVDVLKWNQLAITQELEYWMNKHENGNALWFAAGASQPPWLLALDGRYRKIDATWNCASCGRHQMSIKEVNHMMRHGFNLSAAGAKLFRVKEGLQARPFIVNCSSNAKMLHFNGYLKPWSRRCWPQWADGALCAYPQSLLTDSVDTFSRRIVDDFLPCHQLWFKFAASGLITDQTLVTADACRAPPELPYDLRPQATSPIPRKRSPLPFDLKSMFNTNEHAKALFDKVKPVKKDASQVLRDIGYN